MNDGSELGVVERQAEGELGQGFGWLGSATDRCQCVECGGRTGQVGWLGSAKDRRQCMECGGWTGQVGWLGSATDR